MVVVRVFCPEGTPAAAAARELFSEDGGRDASTDPTHVCGYCLGSNHDSNPCPNRHCGDCLVFATLTECLPCRNYANSCLKGTDKHELRDKLAASTDNRQQYCSAQSGFTTIFDNMPPGGQAKAADKAAVPLLGFIEVYVVSYESPI